MQFCGKKVGLSGKEGDGCEIWWERSGKKIVKCWDCVKNKRYVRSEGVEYV